MSLLCGLLGLIAQAATFKLTDGRTVTGDLVASGCNDATALINVGDNKYERVPWGQFSQEDMKAFLEKYSGNKKITEAVEPFIEPDESERVAKTEVTIKPVDPAVLAIQNENQQPKSSVIPSLFKSGLGLFLVLLIYAANVYAGYEISIFRAQSTPLVAGLAAIPVLGFLSNIVFISLPTQVEKKSEEELAFEAERANNPNPPTIALPGQEEAAQAAAEAEVAAAAPKAEIFNRSQFTFNKRFFETKFANYFGVVRREEDRAKVLVFKTSKGEFIAQRITRITISELHIQADRGGGASVETSIPFTGIQEVIIKPHA